MSGADPRANASAFEIALVIAIFAGWFIVGSLSAVLRGFPAPALSESDAWGLIAMEGFAFLVAGAILWGRGWRRRDFGFSITWRLSLMGLLLFAACLGIYYVTHPLFGRILGGADFVDDFGAHILMALPTAIALSVVNGAFEEFFVTRYLIDALAAAGAPVALGMSALVRVLYHLYQGPAGAAGVLLFGIVVGLFYWRTREIWPVMVAHMASDFVAFV